MNFEELFVELNIYKIERKKKNSDLNFFLPSIQSIDVFTF